MSKLQDRCKKASDRWKGRSASLQLLGHEHAKFIAFRVLWAVYVLLELLSFPQWVYEPAGIALFLTMLAVLLNPASLQRFAAMCAVSVLYASVRSPELPTHILLSATAELVMCCVIGRHALRSAPSPERDAEIYKELAAILRWLLCMLYFFAVLHKLNWDFLRAETSCAGFMLQALADQVPLIPTGPVFASAAIWGTLLVEAAIPLMLLRPAWTRAGVGLAFAFHFALGFLPIRNYSYSFLVYGLLFLFFPDDFLIRARAWFRSHRMQQGIWRGVDRIRGWALLSGLGAACLATAFALATYFGAFDLRGSGYSDVPLRIGMGLWVVCASVFGVALFGFWPRSAKSRSSTERMHRTSRSPVYWLLLPLALQCVAPYFGLQTVPCFSMYSNLRTEGGETNHLFIPSTMQIAGYQNDLVEIVSSSEATLQYNAQHGELLPYFELRRRAWRGGARVLVTYRRLGKTHRVDTSQPDAAEELPPVSWLAGKTLAFRGVDAEVPCKCRW